MAVSSFFFHDLRQNIWNAEAGMEMGMEEEGIIVRL